MMKVNIKGIQFHIRTAGSGPALLLIHGYPLNSSLWEPQLAGLAGTARIIAPDLRGHGESSPVTGPYSMDLLAEDCHAVLEALEITEPVIVGGLSMGGYVAFAFYRKYPHRVAALILAATRPGADSEPGMAARDAAADLAREMGPKAIAAGMLPKMLAPDTYTSKPDLVAAAQNMMASTSLEGILGDLEGMKNRPDSTPLLTSIGVPTLILHGREDQIIPTSEAELMSEAIPGAHLEVLADSGHLLNLEQSDLFNDAVKDFIAAHRS